jgi:hypothetical protein
LSHVPCDAAILEKTLQGRFPRGARVGVRCHIGIRRRPCGKISEMGLSRWEVVEAVVPTAYVPLGGWHSRPFNIQTSHRLCLADTEIFSLASDSGFHCESGG